MDKNSSKKKREIHLFAEYLSDELSKVKAYDKNFYVDAIYCPKELIGNNDYFKEALDVLLIGYFESEKFNFKK